MNSKKALDILKELELQRKKDKYSHSTKAFMRKHKFIQEAKEIYDKFKDGCGEDFKGMSRSSPWSIKPCGRGKWLGKVELCKNCQEIKRIIDEFAISELNEGGKPNEN